jgi:hypothetical protein
MTSAYSFDPPAPGHLVRYERACRAVAKARTVDEVQEIASNADVRLRQASEEQATRARRHRIRIRIRAERRWGELMQGAGRTIGRAKGGQPYQLTATGLRQNPVGTPTLAEAGIDKNLAHRARTLAAMPEEEFQELLDEKRHWQDRRVVLAPDRGDAGSSRRRAPRGRSKPCGPRTPTHGRKKVSHFPGHWWQVESRSLSLGCTRMSHLKKCPISGTLTAPGRTGGWFHFPRSRRARRRHMADTGSVRQHRGSAAHRPVFLRSLPAPLRQVQASDISSSTPRRRRAACTARAKMWPFRLRRPVH